MREERKEIDRRENDFRREIESLHSKLLKLENIEHENDDNIKKLSKLYEAGLINEDGEYINNRME